MLKAIQVYKMKVCYNQLARRKPSHALYPMIIIPTTSIILILFKILIMITVLSF